MTNSVDVAIVGAGMVGVCTADALVSRGVRVALLDRGDVCSGASYGNAGWISPSHCLPIPQPGVIREGLRWLGDPESPFYIKPRASLALLRWLWQFRKACNAEMVTRSSRLRRELSFASLERYAKLAERPELDFHFERKGLMLVCRTTAGLDHARHELERLRELGGKGELLSSDELHARVPSLVPGLAGAVSYAEDAHLDPAAFVTTLAADLVRRGATIHERSEVLEVTWTRGSGVKLRTTHGELRCNELVLATGAWTPELSDSLGVRLPIESAKGYSLTLRTDARLVSTPLLLMEARVAVTPLGDRLRFAGTLELAGRDLSVNLRRVRAIERAIGQHFATPPSLETVETWRGLRPLTPDDQPIIGRPAGTHGLVIAAGHGMNGIAQGPMTGELVAQLLTGEKPSMDLAPFSPDRFE